MKKIVSLFSFLFFLTLGAVHSSTLEECEGYYDPYVWTDCYGIFDGEKSSYAGEWKNGKMHGQGTFTNADGSKYVGEWDGGDKQGQGTFYHADGRKDVGEFYNGKMNGYAIQYNAEGIIIREGIFKNDEFLYAEIREKEELSSQEIPDISNLSKETQSSIRIACSVAKGEGPSSYAKCINQQLASIGISLEKKETSSQESSLPPCPSGTNAIWDNCFGTYTFSDGAKYVGEWKDGQANGQGTSTFASGSIYVGEWKNDKKNGQGTYYFLADNEFKGDKYVGEFKDDIYNGQGTYTFASGDKYVGDYKDGKRHGQGTYIHADGSKYIGEYKDGLINGQGTYTFANGDKYIGQYKDGQANGQGTYTFASGRKDVGEWENDKLNGYAIKYNADGTIRREGIFKDDQFLYAETREKKDPSSQMSSLPPCPSDKSVTWDNCFGTYEFDDGEKYIGEWKNNLYDGQGTYVYNNGDKFIGAFKYGLANGQGTYTFSNGAEYSGEYKNDKRHGQGTYIWADGRKDVGEWENNKLNGYAIQYNADGTIRREGIFKDDGFLYAETREKKEPSKLDKYKSTCEEIGFTPGTEKFGDCVMKLMDKD